MPLTLEPCRCLQPERINLPGMVALQQCIQDLGEQMMVAEPGAAGIEGDQEQADTAKIVQHLSAGWIAGNGFT